MTALSLALGLGLGPRGGGFDPASLFANNEQGVWFDPSDISTMFQDTAGTAPVTAPGQTVALMLDKSRGLVRGVDQRGIGVPVNIGVPPAPASYDPLTGAGTSARTDVSNLSVIRFTVATGRFYEVDIQNTSASGSISVRDSGVPVPTGIAPGVRTVVRIFIGTNLQIFNDANGTTASFIIRSIRAIPGNHAVQATGSFRPAYQIDGTDLPFLLFDGVDDFLATSTITPGIDKGQMIAGIRKLSDAARGAIAQMDTGTSRLSIEAPSVSPARYGAWSGGSTFTQAQTSLPAFNAPNTAVVANISDISAPSTVLRINRNQVGQSLGPQGTGNYAAMPLFVGRAGGTSSPFNGRIYGLITRFGPNLPENLISAAETWMNGKTGAY